MVEARRKLGFQGPPETSGEPSAATRHKPLLTHWLRTLGMDVAWERAEGVWLHPPADAAPYAPVLDCVGGFGSLLLGHAPPRLIEAAVSFWTHRRPSLVQGSASPLAEQLARRLAERCGGDYRCVFSSTGAEAVETALKHALLETNRREFLAVRGAYHGKTSGALQITWRAEYRAPFRSDGSVHWVPPNDLAALQDIFQRCGPRLAAMIVEPIQGEAGVLPLDAGFLQLAAELCRRHQAPLIMDECQTGMGRTGDFLACHQAGVQPDYIVLSKSLGGGIAKLAATLIASSRYRPDFDWMHSSTFAADGFSTAMGLEVLSLIDEQLLAVVRARGDALRARLRDVVRRWPDVLAEVRGRGLMLGLQFREQLDSRSFILRLLAGRGHGLHLGAAYLLHRHRIRVLPTLGNPDTLRIQPPASWLDEHTEMLVQALEELCGRLRQGDALGLVASLPEATAPTTASPPVPTEFPLVCFHQQRFAEQESARPEDAPRLAWLCHMIDANDLRNQEPTFDQYTLRERERLLRRMSSLSSPVVMSSAAVRMGGGETLRLYPIMLPFTSRMARDWLDRGELEWPRRLIRSGLEQAEKLGCGLVSLGQYTSILTRNGRSLPRSPMGVTSGNTYTVDLTLQALRDAIRRRGLTVGECTLAVVGGAGNIGKICATLLAPEFRRTLILGGSRPRSRSRAEELARRLPRAAAAAAETCGAADVVLCAVNAAETVLSREMLRSASIVCDVSVPSATGAELIEALPQVEFVTGGLASLPGGEDLEIASFPLPPGRTFGCMAEGLLLAAGGHWDRRCTGPVTRDNLALLQELAARHGFQLAVAKQGCVFGGGPEPRASSLAAAASPPPCSPPR